MSEQIPPLPRRRKRAKTMLRGLEIRQALQKMGVPIGQLSRLTGMNESRLQRQLKGAEDDDLPLIYELVLFALYHHPELRKLSGPIDLPFDEWGIDIVVVDDDEPKS